MILHARIKLNFYGRIFSAYGEGQYFEIPSLKSAVLVGKTLE